MQKYNAKLKSDLRGRCYSFGLDVIEMTNTLPNKRSAWIITDQLIRSATSVGANLVEARASSSRLEYKKFFEISLKSANESHYWLELLRDAKLATPDKIDPLVDEVSQLASMIATAVIKLKKK